MRGGERERKMGMGRKIWIRREIETLGGGEGGGREIEIRREMDLRRDKEMGELGDGEGNRGGRWRWEERRYWVGRWRWGRRWREMGGGGVERKGAMENWRDREMGRKRERRGR